MNVHLQTHRDSPMCLVLSTHGRFVAYEKRRYWWFWYYYQPIESFNSVEHAWAFLTQYNYARAEGGTHDLS